jgi:hypothetical protein
LVTLIFLGPRRDIVQLRMAKRARPSTPPRFQIAGLFTFGGHGLTAANCRERFALKIHETTAGGETGPRRRPPQ